MKHTVLRGTARMPPDAFYLPQAPCIMPDEPIPSATFAHRNPIMSHADKNAPLSPLIQTLSSYMAGAMKRKLPDDVVERAKVHLVDTFAAMISGSRLLPGKRAIAFVKPLGGTREAGVIGTRMVTSVANAALANGIFGHADETDDVHPPSRSHPGASIVPATLAMAERLHSPGNALLRAMVLGYDINARLLLCLRDAQMIRLGFHPSSKGGLFGSAAAAAGLLKLDARKMRYLLSYCTAQASGLFTVLRDTQHIEKAFTVGGMPAHNGVMAALMVASGFTGVEDVLTGDANVLSVYSNDADRDKLVAGLGSEYEIMRAAIKRWSAGGPIQGPLHVLYDLIREHRFKADDVVKLVARMPDKELRIVDNRDMGNITVQHLLAVMLIDGTVTFKSAHDVKRTRDPRVLKLRREHIEAVGDASLTDPLRRWRCVMEVTLKDGRTLTHQTMSARGGSDNPLSRADEHEKALDLMAPVLGKARSQALISALFSIETIRDTCELRRLYAA
jgi:2-methylcitrate dehydratase PrpD